MDAALRPIGVFKQRFQQRLKVTGGYRDSPALPGLLWIGSSLLVGRGCSERKASHWLGRDRNASERCHVSLGLRVAHQPTGAQATFEGNSVVYRLDLTHSDLLDGDFG